MERKLEGGGEGGVPRPRGGSLRGFVINGGSGLLIGTALGKLHF